MKNDRLNNIDWELITSILDGTSNLEEQKKFEEWVEDEDNKVYFQEIESTWKATGNISYCFNEETNKAWAEVSNKTIKRKTANYRIGIRILQLAASIALLFFVGRYFLVDEKIELLSESQIIEDYILPDSSIVSLNKNSKLAFIEGLEGDKRELWLEGEAYFSVKRNPEKPFIINLDKSAIKVLGTSFNIKEDKENEFIELNVNSGKVQFSAFGINKQVIATKGQAVRFDLKKQKLLHFTKLNANFLAWKTKVFRFEQMPLEDIVSLLRDVYGERIVIKTEELKQLKFSASFNNQSLEKILEVIALALDIEIKEKNQTIELHKEL